MAGLVEAAVGYSEAGQVVLGNGRRDVPFGSEGLLGAAYLGIGESERWIEECRAQLARGRDTHTMTRAHLAIALAAAGLQQEAVTTAAGLIDAADATPTRSYNRMQFSHTATPIAKPIPPTHWRRCVVAWQSRMTAETATTSQVWLPVWLNSKPTEASYPRT
jgi:hypothetical protein